jgi:hypothetical protein
LSAGTLLRAALNVLWSAWELSFTVAFRCRESLQDAKFAALLNGLVIDAGLAVIVRGRHGVFIRTLRDSV